jgi:hypothetical protein
MVASSLAPQINFGRCYEYFHFYHEYHQVLQENLNPFEEILQGVGEVLIPMIAERIEHSAERCEEVFFAMRHAFGHPHLNPPPQGGGDF